MARVGISLSDDLEKRMDEAAEQKGLTVSGLIADALEAYLAKDGASKTPPADPKSNGSSSSSAGTKSPPSTTDPTTPTGTAQTYSDPRVDVLIAAQQKLEQLVQQILQRLTAHDMILEQNKKDIGDLDMRLSKLWHDVHEK